MTLDDSQEKFYEQVPFDLDLAQEILNNKRKGKIVYKNGKEARIDIKHSDYNRIYVFYQSQWGDIREHPYNSDGTCSYLSDSLSLVIRLYR